MSSLTFHNLILESISEGILISNASGQIIYVNPAFEAMFGYSKEEIMGQKVEKLIPFNLAKTHEHKRMDYQANPHKKTMGARSNLMGLKKDGTVFTTKVGLNHLTAEGQKYIVATITDTTLYYEVEKAKEEAEKRLQTYMDISKAMLLVLNENKTIEYINEEVCRLTGYSKNEIIGKNWFDIFIPEEDRKQLDQIFNEIKIGKVNDLDIFKNDIITKDNRRITVEWRNSILRLVTDGTFKVVSSGLDVTHQKNAEIQKHLALLEGMEGERKRIALELHDGLVQSLSYVSMNLRALESEITALPPSKIDLYNNALNMLLKTIKDTRSLSHNMLPIELEHFGLQGAVTNLVNALNKISDIRFELIYNATCTLSEFVTINLYRIIQELLQNISTHSEATKATINITENNSTLTMTVKDNGKGFKGTINEAMDNGIGIKNITTRARAINASIKLDSAKNKGVTTIIEVPIA